MLRRRLARLCESHLRRTRLSRVIRVLRCSCFTFTLNLLVLERDLLLLLSVVTVVWL